MKATDILIERGITPDPYPADAIFGEYSNEPVMGTYSKDRKTACIMIEDNLTEQEQQDLDKCILPAHIVKDIAYTVDHLITNFGLSVHSYDMKNTTPFKSLRITKTIS